ncbi:alpha/beta hydrolase [Streptomyces sp. SH5]|uniref:alpha/beta hydrolase n=1 Tax=Streptomyces sp. SH5 TaxID=3041765 RepID=UPI00247824DF|nr:alpha/beta hydrolase [Streptomyces sp. SH5]WGP14639.1 alpha/beta hydrolase [Streptomyces sp. SH5]
MRTHRGTRRATARTGTALLTAVLLSGCGLSSGEPEPSGTADSRPADASAPPAPSAAQDSPTTPRLPSALTSQRLDWKRCTAPRGGNAPDSSWRCANVDVPLDYAEPAGKTLSVALIRKEARDRGRRIGSLLFNFGGPGGSGVATLPRAAGQYEKLNSRYDLVSFDPRGVAASSGVRCRLDQEQENAHRTVDLTPDTAAEEDAFFADAADFGVGCERRSGEVLPHVGTSNAARDLDLIRQVLGDDKLSYLGFSYGTELGGTYAHLFPHHVGRTVLDAVVDPTADAVGHARNQTRGFQRALENYLKDRGQDPRTGSERIARLLARIDRSPLPTGSGRELTESLAITGIVTPLYSESSWPELTAALDEAENNGTGDELLRLADAYNGRDARGRYDTQSHSQRAISCADSASRPTLDEARALVPEFRRLSPVFGPFLAWDTAGWCAQWPVDGEYETPRTSAPGAAPILVVGTTGDPATPYEGARRMADELGEGVGVLVTNEGEGHGAYGSNACVTSTIDDYFLDGKVPADGKTCG